MESSCSVLPDEMMGNDCQAFPLLEAQPPQAHDRPHQFKAKHAVATAMFDEPNLIQHHATRDAHLNGPRRARPAITLTSDFFLSAHDS